MTNHKLSNKFRTKDKLLITSKKIIELKVWKNKVEKLRGAAEFILFLSKNSLNDGITDALKRFQLVRMLF